MAFDGVFYIRLSSSLVYRKKNQDLFDTEILFITRISIISIDNHASVITYPFNGEVSTAYLSIIFLENSWRIIRSITQTGLDHYLTIEVDKDKIGDK